MTHEQHEFGAAFPEMDLDDMQALGQDIRKNGLVEPITLLDGQVLDGWHRLQMCRAADVEPRFEVFPGSEEDARAYVWSKNAERRHMGTYERIQARRALYPSLPIGANQHKGAPSGAPTEERTQDAVAKATGTSRRSVQRYDKVAEHVEPEELAELVHGNKVNAKLAELDEKKADDKPFYVAMHSVARGKKHVAWLGRNGWRADANATEAEAEVIRGVAHMRVTAEELSAALQQAASFQEAAS